ncbi:MAG TPA: hypothetical protein VI546_02425 [candidate division Zixibacteria bacterium]|nr:hypothetical protein [candidate division Zixibacteria bacterium]
MKKWICFAAVLVFIASAGLVNEARAQDTCYAAGDINGDGLVLSVADLVETIRIFSCDAPLPDSNWYQIDFNADCRIDTADLRIYEDYWIYGPGILPRPFPVPTCCNPTLAPYLTAAKGDVNTDGGLTPADVVAILNCVLAGTESCSFCQADLNCDFALSPADVVQELNYVFLGTAPSGCP